MSILRKYPFSLICVALIWMLCFDTTEGMPNVSIPNIDKLVHFAMYFGTCSTIWWERLKATGREDFRWLVCFAIIAPILMSGVIEILQSQTIYRSGDWADLLANSIGVFAAIPLGHFLLKPIFENRSDEQTGDGEDEV